MKNIDQFQLKLNKIHRIYAESYSRVYCYKPTQEGMITGGYKAFASDSVNPVCDEIEGVDFHFAGDEHGVLVLGDSDASIKVGDVVRFVTPHCDPTVNLHDFYWILRGIDPQLLAYCRERLFLADRDA